MANDIIDELKEEDKEVKREDWIEKKKSPANMIVLYIVIAAVIFGVAGYLIGKNKPESKKPSTPIASGSIDMLTATAPASESTTTSAPGDITANWKTYTNDKFGFSLKYPTQLSIADASSYSVGDGLFLDSATTGGYEQAHFFYVEAESTSKTLDEFVNQLVANGSYSEKNQIIVGGKPAYEGVEGGMTNTYSVLVKNGDYIYHIGLDSGNKDTLAESKAQLTDIQQIILSTLQFTK